MPLDPRIVSTRRHFLATQSMSIGSLALAWLLQQDGVRAGQSPRKPTLERPVYDLKPKAPPLRRRRRP